MVAETTYKLAGGKYAKGTGSVSSAIAMFYNYCTLNKLDCSKIRLTDGSGVSKNNLITADFMTDFLISAEKTFGKDKMNTLLAAHENTCEHMFLLPKRSAVCIIQVHHPFGLVWFITYSPLAKVRSTLFLCLFFFYQGLIDTINALTDNFAPSDFGNDMSFAISEFFCIAFGKPYLKPQTFWVFCWSSCTCRLYHLLVWYVHSINEFRTKVKWF